MIQVLRFIGSSVLRFREHRHPLKRNGRTEEPKNRGTGSYGNQFPDVLMNRFCDPHICLSAFRHLNRVSGNG